MTRAMVAAVLLGGVLIPVPVGAQESGFFERTGFGLRLATTGMGIDVAYRALPWLTVRLDGSYVGLDWKGGAGRLFNTEAELAFKLLTAGIIGDLYPWRNDRFHFSAGLGYSRLSLSAKTSAESNAGFLGAGAELESGPFAGYVGFGFGNVAAKQGSFGIVFDLGVILSRATTVADLDEDIASLLKRFNINPRASGEDEFLLPWPVLSLGIVIRPGR